MAAYLANELVCINYMNLDIMVYVLSVSAKLVFADFKTQLYKQTAIFAIYCCYMESGVHVSCVD